MDRRSMIAWMPKPAVVVAALAALALVYFALRPTAVPVDTALVARGPLTITVDEEGKTRVKDLFVVSAPIGGRLLRSPLEIGDAVTKDQTAVAMIEPSPPPFLDLRTQTELQAQIRAARAAVDLARAEAAQSVAELDFAQKELQRAQTLSARDIVSERALQKARVDLESRQAALARAQANVTLRQREFDSISARQISPQGALSDSYGQSCCLTVTSPIDGRVIEIHKKSEQVVLQGTPLMDIGNSEALEVVVELLSADAVQVKVGDPAAISAWGGPELGAVVSRIEPGGFTKVSALGIEEQRVRVVLDLTEQAPQSMRPRLGHGYRAYARISVHHIADALLVPLGAMFRHKSAWAVYVDAGGVAQLRELQLGERDAIQAEVVSGLKVGERVILHPSDQVRDGVRVRLREE